MITEISTSPIKSFYSILDIAILVNVVKPREGQEEEVTEMKVEIRIGVKIKDT